MWWCGDVVIVWKLSEAILLPSSGTKTQPHDFAQGIYATNIKYAIYIQKIPYKALPSTA